MVNKILRIFFITFLIVFLINIKLQAAINVSQEMLEIKTLKIRPAFLLNIDCVLIIE